jgi:O-antigen ligase
VHYNPFDHLHTILPFLQFQGGGLSSLRLGGNLRVSGPSQHPIALGAMLILILPLAVYFARTSSRRWWFAAVLILVGAMASGSRTAVVVLVVEAIVFLMLKPVETKRLWPALVPAVVVLHFALPGTIRGFHDAFFPKGGLIAQQSQLGANSDPMLAGGRVRQIKPMLIEASGRPLFGEGVGTRISGFNTPDRNAPILDNQWLNSVLDVGFLGFAAWVWLFASASRKLIRASREADDEAGDDWLFAALAASVMSLAVGMLTFDAFGFTQVTFLFWILLGISAAALSLPRTQQSRHVFDRTRWS